MRRLAGGLLVLAGLFSTLAWGDHHGTRCLLDMQQNRSDILMVINQTLPHPLTEDTLTQIVDGNMHALEQAKQHGHYPFVDEVPITGGANSLPFSFTTCQIELHQKECPAVKWCYPYEHNTQQIECGRPGVALACVEEKQRCQKNPSLPECRKPTAEEEQCYEHPELKQCDKPAYKALRMNL